MMDFSGLYLFLLLQLYIHWDYQNCHQIHIYRTLPQLPLQKKLHVSNWKYDRLINHLSSELYSKYSTVLFSKQSSCTQYGGRNTESFSGVARSFKINVPLGNEIRTKPTNSMLHHSFKNCRNYLIFPSFKIAVIKKVFNTYFVILM